MRKTLVAISLALVAVVPATAQAADDDGRKVAEGAFHAIGTGDAVVAFGAAAPADPAALEIRESVLIFGYAGGPSQGRTYCGDVWNVIVTVEFGSRSDQAVMEEIFATHTLDGELIGATDETAIRWSSAAQALTQGNGTFLPPGTLTNGTHVVKQTVEHPIFGVLWDPPALSFEVDDSAC
jgi:hypothetical protein